MKRMATVIVCLSLILMDCSHHVNTKYVASPGFSPEKFSKIPIGATLPQTLDALGPPLSIFGPIEGSGAFSLEFTGPTSASLSKAVSKREKMVQWDSYRMTFSEDGLLTRKISAEASMELREGLGQSIQANENLRRSVGDLTFKAASGASTVLNSNDLGLYMILLDKDAPSGRCSINEGPTWLQALMQEMLDDSTLKGIFHVYIGDFPENYSLLGDSIDGLYTQTAPPLGLTVLDEDNGFLLYKAGMLHSLPIARWIPDEYGNPMQYEIGVSVQKWLIKKLGQK